MKIRARTLSISISSLGILATLWLVFNELQTAGHCPTYPLLGIPACYLVLVFFLLVVGAQLVKDRNPLCFVALLTFVALIVLRRM
jgi:hypothetical protein